MVVGSGFVVAHAAAVLVDPRETSLDHPNAGPDVETSGAGDAFDDLHSKGENVFRPDEQPSGVTAVGAQTSRMVEKLPRSATRSRCAASRSWIEAAVTTTASSRPFTSTAMCRLTPFVLLPPSQPPLDRGTVSAAVPSASR